MGNVKLVDCTLGLGGKVLRWNFGETVKSSMLRLLNKSALDIVEIGLLRRRGLGPACSVYTSTKLPVQIQRQSGQSYAMLLDELRPALADIAPHYFDTVDIIRVPVSREYTADTLEYCAGLQKKGYQIAVLVEETAQYHEEELRALLRQIDEITPEICYIFDNSGVLSSEHLDRLFSVFHQELGPAVQIGFHGADNLGLIEALSKHFCQENTARVCCLDSASGGLDTGALQMDTLLAAEWFAEKNGRNYLLPFIQQLQALTVSLTQVKNSAGARLGYYSTAAAGCSYRYTEYYSSLGIDISEHEDICRFLPEGAAFHFAKQAANDALIQYRKRQLNLVVIVPTAGRPMSIEHFLDVSARDLLRCGVDVIIYDSSEDDRTCAVTQNYQMDGYENIYYRRYTAQSDSFFIDNKVICAIGENLDYDYIWCLRDSSIPTISQFYQDLLAAANRGADCIAIDAAERNQYRSATRRYESCADFLCENSSRLTVLGNAIFKNTFIGSVLRNRVLDETNSEFYLTIAPLQELASGEYRMELIVGNTYVYNSARKLKPFWSGDAVRLWGKRWYQVVMALPTVYDPVKHVALRVHLSYFAPFHMLYLIRLRLNGGFSLAILRQYQQYIAAVTDSPMWKLRLAAIMPKGMARLIIRMDEHVAACPQSRFAKVFYRLRDIYIRLGR